MIVIDTNVLSELTRQAPSSEVLSWLDALAAAEVATTAITAAELLYAVAGLPAGRRKDELAAAVKGVLDDDFRGCVLAFDERAASQYAEIVSGREQLGRPIGLVDAQIAAICSVADATLATRNVSDFLEIGIDLINPWKPT